MEIRIAAIVRLAAVAWLLAGAASLQAQDPACTGFDGDLKDFVYHARQNGLNYAVVCMLAQAEWGEFWSISPRCIGPENFQTSQQRGFQYVRMNHSIPSGGRSGVALDMHGNQFSFTVTKEKVDSYWDWEYHQDGYTRKAGTGCDESVNCHGYSLGFATWVNSDIGTVILVDDWQEQFTPDTTLAMTNDNTKHSAKVQFQYCMDPVLFTMTVQIVGIREKFRESGIYKKNGDCPNPVQLKSVVHFKNASNDSGNTAIPAYKLYKRK